MPLPAIQAPQLTDLVAMTLPVLGQMHFTDISFPLQRYRALNELMKENRITPQGGRSIQWRVKTTLGTPSRNVPLVFDDDVTIPDTMQVAECDWRALTTNYGILGPELAMNSSSAKIIDLEQERRIDAMTHLATLVEANFWGPAVAANDSVTPWGVKTWYTRPATYASDGFVGGNPSGYSSIGLDASTIAAWRSYFFKYGSMTPTGFVRPLSLAATLVHFTPPVSEPTYSTGDDWKMYSNLGVIKPLEELLRASNENLGTDIDVFQGEVMFRRSPIYWVPFLENDTSNPVIGVNWGDFKTYTLPGWYLRQTFVPQVPGRHTMSATHIDLIYQHVLKNRRTGFIGATSETDPS